MLPDHTLNLAALAEDAYERLGDHESLLFEGHAYRSGQQLSRAARVGTGLVSLGVRPGDRVVVMLPNCPEVAVAYTAIWRAGGVVTPVIFLLSADELAHVLVDSAATALVTSTALLATVATAARSAPALRHIVLTDDRPGAEGIELPQGIRRLGFDDLESADESGIVLRADEDLAALLYTGGTTGRAKGVMLTHQNLYASSLATHSASRVPGITNTLVPLPLAHAYGLIVTLVGWHALEPQLAVLQRWFDPAGWLDLAQRHRVQRTTLVPSMIRMLLDLPLESADLSQLRYVGSGAAPLPAELRAAWERAVPGSQLLDGYGCTESGCVISTTRPGHMRPGAVGQAIPGYAIEIRDDADSPLPAGADGEICVRAKGVMSGYWKAPETTRFALRDGWLHTGDIGSLDDDGYLYVIDRKKDLILRGGFNVYPRDIEDTLLTHPDIASAGVVGRPDDRLGEEVVAYVTPRPGCVLDPAGLVAYARERLAANKYPREVHVLEQLPLTSVGKLDRKALRRITQARAER
ncbi:AMP-binding protein [Streptomyces sp. NPDC050738]|uniref:class I adenylate-forming enzyme family protein n=1 Tax=Streptomyces sp. NPDC050738 TaxID=3154744 RepID=UPI003448E9DF